MSIPTALPLLLQSLASSLIYSSSVPAQAVHGELYLPVPQQYLSELILVNLLAKGRLLLFPHAQTSTVELFDLVYGKSLT